MGADSAGALQAYLHRVESWRRTSVNRRIFAAMVTVGAGSLALKVASTGKDMVVAAHFGTSDAIDAFFIALTVPTFVIHVIAGSLPAALVPAYVRVREREGAAAAGRLLSGILGSVVVAAVAASALLAWSAPALLPVVGAWFDGEKLAMTRNLFLLLVPATLFGGITSLLSAILNAEERFALPSVTPMLAPVMAVVFLIAAVDRWGVYALGVGTLAGFALEAGILAGVLYRRRLLAAPSWRRWHPETRHVLSQYLPMVLGAAVMGSSPLIDQAMAATLGSGSVATLGYGSKVVAAVLGVGVTAVTTAIFPHFSAMVATNDWAGVRQTLSTYSRLVLVGGVAMVLLVVAFSTPIVRLLFERGAFSEADTRAVAQVQALLALQIPFYVLGMIAVRLLSAMSGNRILMWISFGNFVVNIVGNYVFMRLWGVAGIALATSLVYVIATSVAYRCVIVRINRLSGAALAPARAAS